jgi:hypothetical protein
MFDGRGPGAPADGADGADWAGDPADEWILDPVTGEYRMRLPGERPPAPEPDPLPEPRRPVGAELELRSTRTEVEPHAGSRTAARADSRAGSSRAGGSRGGTRAVERAGAGGSRSADRGRAGGSRAADRRARRSGRRRNSSSGGGLWLAGALGVVGLLGCGAGGYLLLHGGSRPADCTVAARPSTPATPAASPHQTGPTLSPGPSAAPINVRVTIYDGSGKFGEAETVLQWMQNTELYTRTTNGGAAGHIVASTSLVYAPNHADQARTLAAAMHLPPSALHGTGTGTGLRDPMILTLGKDFVAPGKPLASPSTPAPAPSATTPAGCRS